MPQGDPPGQPLAKSNPTLALEDIKTARGNIPLYAVGKFGKTEQEPATEEAADRAAARNGKPALSAICGRQASTAASIPWSRRHATRATAENSSSRGAGPWSGCFLGACPSPSGRTQQTCKTYPAAVVEAATTMRMGMGRRRKSAVRCCVFSPPSP